MASDPTGGGAERGRTAGEAPAPSADSPKPHGDKMEHAFRGGAAPSAGGAGAAGGGATPPSGDSPKPHGDKLEHAVREAAGKFADKQR